MTRRIVWACIVSVLFGSQVSSTAVASEGQISISLVAPAPGTVINPDLPFIITLALKGGKAATAKSCHDYSNIDMLDRLTFGGQAVDTNNLGKSLYWGIPGNDFRTTNGGLVGWSARIIPNGIECSIGVIKESVSGSGVASFSEGLRSEDYEWFGTKQSSWSGDVTNFGKYSYVEFAWKYKGEITKNRFQASSLGTPEVKIIGLQRGQVIDYETEFQVVGTASSKLKLEALYVAVDGSGIERYIDCDSNKPMSKDNGNGTTTYSRTCRLSFVYATTPKASIAVEPVMRTSPVVPKSPQDEIVMVNLGMQGKPTCIDFNYEVKQFVSEANSQLASNQKKFKTTTTAAGAKLLATELKKLLELSRLKNEGLKMMNNPILECRSQQPLILKSLDALVSQSQLALDKVTQFINDPVAQEKAVIAAKEAAKKAEAEAAVFNRSMYNYGKSFVRGLSAWQLNQLSIGRFLAPGKKSLSKSAAVDWCRKIPTVVPGLNNRVGIPANPYFVKGCSEAAMEIRF